MSVEAQNITVGYYKEVPVLNDVSILAERSKVTAIIGPNGAGKSTVLKAIYGFLKPVKGKILHNGEEITGLKSHEMIRRGMVYLMQGKSVFPLLTVLENLEIGGWIIRGNRKELQSAIGEAFDRHPVLKEKMKVKARMLSGGQQRTLELARSLMTKPGTILLDEPSASLSPKLVQLVYHQITELKEEGFTIILVDQCIQDAVSVADYVYILEFGRNAEEGKADDVRVRLPSIIKIWL